MDAARRRLRFWIRAALVVLVLLVFRDWIVDFVMGWIAVLSLFLTILLVVIPFGLVAAIPSAFLRFLTRGGGQ
jgi:cation transport ATPase